MWQRVYWNDAIFVNFSFSFTPISDLDLIGLYVIPHAHPCRSFLRYVALFPVLPCSEVCGGRVRYLGRQVGR